MNPDNDLPSLAQSPHTSSTKPISLVLLCHRAHGLGITTHEVLACATVGDLQVLVKQRYHTLARDAHPDAIARRKLEGMRTTILGYNFRRLTTTYTFLMALSPTQVIDGSQGCTVPDIPLPWALDRSTLSLGTGYHEIPMYW